MGRGFLQIETQTATGALPVGNARITIRRNGDIIQQMTTNANGNTDKLTIDTPDKWHTLEPNDAGPYYTSVDVEAVADRYGTVVVHGAKIYDGETTILPIQMLPATSTRSGGGVTEYDISQPNALHSSAPRMQYSDYTESINSRVLKEVIIPENITVHLGTYSNANAQNVTVPFISYLKNVASHEIYPTWPAAALEANILCQITFALNRIYTEWYPARGYNFNITNSTAQDQYYVWGGEIFQSVSVIVDRIFNHYVRREGYKEPYFTEYCNGTTAVCPGLSQWGTVDLANAGMTPIEILRYYYPKDIQIVVSNNVSPIYSSYPGAPLSQGQTSANVKTIQDYLNRIRVNFPLIPTISNPNGYYGADTTAAVKVFQDQVLHETATGIVDRNTWNKISSYYVAAKKLGELVSEGERLGIGKTPPTSTIEEGARGNDVVELQFILQYIASEYAQIPPVLQNGSFDARTKQAVIEFQKMAKLTPDGKVGPATWRKLYEYYNLINSVIPVPPEQGEETYPGYLIKKYMSGSAVRVIQDRLNAIALRYPIPKLTVDGEFGSGTEAAVKAFQNLFGLTADGIVGPATWNKIMSVYHQVPPGYPYPGYILQVGTGSGTGGKGDSNVLLMQKFLNVIAKSYGLTPVSEDGIFGNKTASTVSAFQSDMGLVPDGKIGPATWDAIVKTYNYLTGGTGGLTGNVALNQNMSGMGNIPPSGNGNVEIRRSNGINNLNNVNSDTFSNNADYYNANNAMTYDNANMNGINNGDYYGTNDMETYDGMNENGVGNGNGNYYGTNDTVQYDYYGNGANNTAQSGYYGNGANNTAQYDYYGNGANNAAQSDYYGNGANNATQSGYYGNGANNTAQSGYYGNGVNNAVQSDYYGNGANNAAQSDYYGNGANNAAQSGYYGNNADYYDADNAIPAEDMNVKPVNDTAPPINKCTNCNKTPSLYTNPEATRDVVYAARIDDYDYRRPSYDRYDELCPFAEKHQYNPYIYRRIDRNSRCDRDDRGGRC